MKFFVGAIMLTCALTGVVAACPQELAPNAPQDKLVRSTGEQKFELAIAPYVKKARETLPDAKKKFRRGLRKGEILFVTTRIHANGTFEQIFVRVKSWEGDSIQGTLASDIAIVPNHHIGEALNCKESEVVDWTISKPDGSEEGNFVGKFLDTYKP